MAVPRPLPVRTACVHETATQTDEHAGTIPAVLDDHRSSAPSQRYRMCDYFENVSPVSSPLTSNLVASNGPSIDREQVLFDSSLDFDYDLLNL